MKLTIFAATGGIGQQLLAQASAAGHDVTAVVRDPRKLAQAAWDAVRVVEADLGTAASAQIESAVGGADAVLSGLGARSFADADAGITWRGTRAIVEAMAAADVRRIVAVSAAPIGTVPTPGRPEPAEARSRRRILHASSLRTVRADRVPSPVRRRCAHGGRAS